MYRSTNKTVYSATYHIIWWFVSTVGGAPPEVVRQYVENRKLVA